MTSEIKEAVLEGWKIQWSGADSAFGEHRVAEVVLPMEWIKERYGMQGVEEVDEGLMDWVMEEEAFRREIEEYYWAQGEEVSGCVRTEGIVRRSKGKWVLEVDVY